MSICLSYILSKKYVKQCSLFLFILIFLHVVLGAQNPTEPPMRIELESAKDVHAFDFEEVGEKGIIIFYEGTTIGDTSNWFFLQYDTLLEKKKIFNIHLPITTSLSGSCHTENYFYALFQTKKSKKNIYQNHLLIYDLNDEKYIVKTLKYLNNNYINYIQAIDNQIVFMSLNDKNDSIFFYDCLQEELYTLGDIFPYKYQFCEVDTFNQRWLIALTEYRSDIPGEIFIYQYHYNTKKAEIQSFIHKGETQNVAYNSARAIVLNADTTLIIGTYNTIKNKTSSGYNTGIYSMLLRHFQLDTAKFYNFTQLKTKEKDVITNKKPTDHLQLQLIVGKVAHNNQLYTLSSEIYYPEYRENDYNNAGIGVGFGGISYSPPTTVFVGYRFIGSYLITFDRTGNLLFDNYLNLNNSLYNTLYPHIRMNYIGDDLLAYYPHGNHFTYTLLHGYDIIEKQATMNIETNHPRDIIEYNRATFIQPWYSNYYILSGYQYILNRSKSIQKKRYVFFINKLEYK